MLYTKYTYIEEALLSKDEEKEIWKANWQKINKKFYLKLLESDQE